MREKNNDCLSVSGITVQAFSLGGRWGLGERVFHKNIIDEEEWFIVMSNLNWYNPTTTAALTIPRDTIW